jgi:chromosomal replication initiator protein
MSEFAPAHLWGSVCQQLKQTLSSYTYDTWIAQATLQEWRPIGDDRAIGVIACQSPFHVSTIEKNFYAQIKEVLDNTTLKKWELQFRVGVPSEPAQATVIQSTDSAAPVDAMPAGVPSPTPSSFSHIPIVNVNTIQERLRSLAHSQQTQGDQATASNSSSVSQAPPLSPATFFAETQSNSQLPAASLFSDQVIRAASVDRQKVLAQKSGLRLDYTFESFAVSASNEMAHAAALAVSASPGAAYNPLFIYGGVGVGKTHLMHAVGNNIIRQFAEKRVLYTTGEEFMNEIVQAIQTKKTLLFKEKFRSAHVLLLDDVQFIAGKNTVQEEFFHTFNAIVQHGGQIVLTSDRPPEDIRLLEDRLRSRFQAGLMVDIQQPSFELRSAIVLIKATHFQLHIPMDIAQLIASKLDSARKIEGILRRLVSEVRLNRRELNHELIEKILAQEEKKLPPTIRLKPLDVIRIVADHFGIKMTALRGTQRVKSLVAARHLCMYILKHDLHLTLMEIAALFSGRDHTSVIHAVEKIETELLISASVRDDLEKIRRSCGVENV